MQETLSTYPNLSVLKGSAAELILEDVDGSDGADVHKPEVRARVKGLKLETGEILECQQIVISTGTFLGGKINVGKSLPSACSRIFHTHRSVIFAPHH
jgi:tRNA U34 5-carboxymethylaminomethyl modifying enzyme MnmG/GidA